MIITVIPSDLSGSVDIIASKSLSHRYLIAAGLSESPSQISNLMESNDIDTTKEALRCLGASIEGARIVGGFPKLKCTTINARESGSTLRFLIPLAMCQSKPVMFIGEARLPKRSLAPYELVFKNKNLIYEKLSNEYLPIRISGPLYPGTFRIKGNVSSQFISGLLFALPLLQEDSNILVEPPFESKSYVDLTIETLKDFKITVIPTKTGYHIPGKQRYQPVHTEIEGDYSQAAFFIVAALINKQPLTIHNLNPNSIQGDREILTIIKRMQGKYYFNNTTLKVYPSPTVGTTINLANIPDLGPILMILAAVSNGRTIFTNIRRLRFKESDRIKAISTILTQCDVIHTVEDNTMIIEGRERLKGNQTFDSFNDHRIVMALIVASLKFDGPISITNAQAINKSYPQFFDVFKALKGTIISKEET